ncbi:MAG: class I SAM-dependent methyltransferase [Roseburia sp.]|nr:class I SAM-dependent methyltransferase [Roseburia sp.]
MDSTQNFSGLAKEYTIGRPAYAAEFINMLYNYYGFSSQSVIADIGSGTGKFAKQLLEKGGFVYCVEPNDDMRAAAEKELSAYNNFQAVKGTATETTLTEHSVDFVTTAQAFHWFDVEAFQYECRRILKENGLVFLIWNMRDMSYSMNQECYDIYKKYCPNFKGFGGGIQKDDVRIKQFFSNNYNYLEFSNDIFYEKETFISRSLSGSYSLKCDDKNYNEYIKALENVFNKHALGNQLRMKNKTVVYFGKVII